MSVKRVYFNLLVANRVWIVNVGLQRWKRRYVSIYFSLGNQSIRGNYGSGTLGVISTCNLEKTVFLVIFFHVVLYVQYLMYFYNGRCNLKHFRIPEPTSGRTSEKSCLAMRTTFLLIIISSSKYKKQILQQ